jgi:hypothetical protein
MKSPFEVFSLTELIFMKSLIHYYLVQVLTNYKTKLEVTHGQNLDSGASDCRAR